MAFSANNIETNNPKQQSAWRNRYFGIRHGQSEANTGAIIVSYPENGLNNFGLTSHGSTQITEAAEKMKIMLAQIGKTVKDIILITSDFRRCLETATILYTELEVEADLRIEEALRERNFGDLEFSQVDKYIRVWENDIKDPSKPKFNEETVFSVAKRLQKLLTVLENEYSNKVIIFVSHGDVLQIMTTMFMGRKPNEHREIPYLWNGSIRNMSDQAGDVIQKLKQLRKNKFFLVRHGQAESNIKKMLVSSMEDAERAYGLTDLGHQQALTTAGDLKRLLTGADKEFHPENVLVVTSPLLRAVETATIIHKDLGCLQPILKDHALIERQFGDLNLTEENNILKIWEMDCINMYTAPSGAEPLMTMLSRMVEVMKRLESRHSGMKIILVSHGDLIKKIKLILHGLPPHYDPMKIRVLNCSIIPIVFSRDDSCIM